MHLADRIVEIRALLSVSARTREWHVMECSILARIRVIAYRRPHSNHRTCLSCQEARAVRERVSVLCEQVWFDLAFWSA